MAPGPGQATVGKCRVESGSGDSESSDRLRCSCGTGTPRQSDLRLSHTEKDSVSPKKHSVISTVPGSLFCAGFSVLRPVYSFAESGDTQHWFHSACHFPETKGTGQQAVKQLRPIFRSCIKFSQLFLLLLLVLLHLKLHTLARGSPPPENLP